MTAAEQPTVRPGQVWQDCDPRYDATRLHRYLRVESIDSQMDHQRRANVSVAVCKSWWAPSPTGVPETPLRTTRVRVSRLRPAAFRLASDAPGEAKADA